MASISGLVSGLDTATIISQLMQVEANPQTLLKNRQSSERLTVAAMQTLNAKVASLATRATDLAKGTAWNPLRTTSSSTQVTVVATAGSTPGGTSFTIGQTARAHRLDFSATAALGDRVTGPDSTVVRLDRLDGTTLDVETGDGTLSGLVAALNTSETGLRAATVRLDDGTYRLTVTSRATGQTSDFALTRADGSPLLGGATATAGRNATITVGSDTVSSSTNTFSGVISGLDVTLATNATTGTEVQVEVTSDVAGARSQAQALVDATNAVLAELDSLTAYNPTTKAKGALAGDAGARELRNQLLDSVTGGRDGSLATVGVQVDRSGRLTFDATAFDKAFAADPTGVRDRFAGSATYAGTGDVKVTGTSWRTSPGTYPVSADGSAVLIAGSPATGVGTTWTADPTSRASGTVLTLTGTAEGTITVAHGLAARLSAIASRASDATDGSLTGAIKTRNASIEDMTDQISAWDVRLEVRRASLERTYASLETALGRLQTQSQWLAGQLAGLPTSSSGA